MKGRQSRFLGCRVRKMLISDLDVDCSLLSCLIGNLTGTDGCEVLVPYELAVRLMESDWLKCCWAVMRLAEWCCHYLRCWWVIQIY